MDYLLPFKKYATFSGRASRREYWMFVLMFQFAPLVLVPIFLVFFFASITPQNSLNPVLFTFLFLGVYWLATLLPSLAVGVRRLHDTNKSGWWMLIGFIPFGSLILLLFFILPSSPGRNQYDTETTSIGEQPTSTMGAVSAPSGVDQGLQNYIQKSKEAGKTEEEIRATLIANSWSEASINQAFDSLKGHIVTDTVSEKPVDNFVSDKDTSNALLVRTIVLLLIVIVVGLIWFM